MKPLTRSPSPQLRLAASVSLATVELLATTMFARLPDVWDIWPMMGVAHATVKVIVLSLVIFALISWPKRAEIVSAFNHSALGAPLLPTAAVSIAALLSTALIRYYIAQAPQDSATLASYLYAATLLTTVISLILVAAPISFWRIIIRTCRLELVLSLFFGLFGLTVGELLKRAGGSFFSEENWAELSDVTLQLSYWIAKSIDSGTFMDQSTRILGAGTFSVQIFAACSGYEGMILIAAFLVAYILLFRKALRFPNVLVLFPLAMAAIWILNSFRIAFLILIGAHFSPEIALGGFHSQFGWISFLLVAITIMTFARRLTFFGATANAQTPGNRELPAQRDAEANPALVYLAPFIALMAAQIATRVAAPHDFLLYPLKVVAVLGVLAAMYRVYARFLSVPALSAIVLGGIAGIFWVATDPAAGTQTELAKSLAGISPAAFTAWLIFRGLGTIVTVPIAEELAFRGYLYRMMIASRFEEVDPRTLRVLALVISSLLFGLMHDRWLEATLAGALYALLMIRRGKIEDAIAAHMTTNAVIFAWAIAAGQWSLL